MPIRFVLALHAGPGATWSSPVWGARPPCAQHAAFHSPGLSDGASQRHASWQLSTQPAIPNTGLWRVSTLCVQRRAPHPHPWEGLFPGTNAGKDLIRNLSQGPRPCTLPGTQSPSCLPAPNLAKAGSTRRCCSQVILPPSVFPKAQRENAFLLEFCFSDHEQHLTGDGLSQAVGWRASLIAKLGYINVLEPFLDLSSQTQTCKTQSSLV